MHQSKYMVFFPPCIKAWSWCSVAVFILHFSTLQSNILRTLPVFAVPDFFFVRKYNCINKLYIEQQSIIQKGQLLTEFPDFCELQNDCDGALCDEGGRLGWSATYDPLPTNLYAYRLIDLLQLYTRGPK